MSVLKPSVQKNATHFCKNVGRAINRFQMIQNGDRILVAVSGGKDSLSLSYALAKRRKWIPILYELHALHINWREYPLARDELDGLGCFFEDLRIPFRPVYASIFPLSFRGEFNCYLCSRNRKRILFTASEKDGFNKIALGHTLDDAVETTLINLLFRGQFSTMTPVQDFFNGKLKIIRPMTQVKEKDRRKISEALGLPVTRQTCPNAQSNQRLIIKEMIRKLSRVDRNIREHICRAPWHINKDYLPSHFLQPSVKPK